MHLNHRNTFLIAYGQKIIHVFCIKRSVNLKYLISFSSSKILLLLLLYIHYICVYLYIRLRPCVLYTLKTSMQYTYFMHEIDLYTNTNTNCGHNNNKQIKSNINSRECSRRARVGPSNLTSAVAQRSYFL